MTINQINPRKVKTVSIIVKDYHLDVGQEVKVYWNKQSKRFMTICGEQDQFGNNYCGNWAVFQENFKEI